MDLYVESLVHYVTKRWDEAFGRAEGACEARLILQSLDPESAFELFRALEGHKLLWVQNKKTKAYFRVAANLWRDWCRTDGLDPLMSQMASFGGVGADGSPQWIDLEDRLTWYRNRTTRDEDVDGLVVVLVGMNHATDQGGLEEFHQVDERRIWNELDESFEPWLRRICERCALEASDEELGQFDVVMKQLFHLNPLRLKSMADFLEREVIGGHRFCEFSEFVAAFMCKLPFWGVPPILSGGRTGALVGRRGAVAVSAAGEFISHSRYKTGSAQKRDWDKIERAILSGALEAPRDANGAAGCGDSGEYSDLLRKFIFDANSAAKARLLNLDILPLLRVLDGKTVEGERPTPRKSIPSFSGMSMQAILQGVWRALSEYQQVYGQSALAENASAVAVELVRFDHDLVADDEEGVGGNDLARDLLRGCLGGFERVIAGIDLRMPVDNEQAQLPRSAWDRQVPIAFDMNLDQIACGASRARPSVQFKVRVAGRGEGQDHESVFRWKLGPTQPERVRFECAKTVKKRWAEHSASGRLLPAFQIPKIAMTALYYAADEDEANRLVANTLADLKLANLLTGLHELHLDAALSALIADAIASYRKWLDVAVDRGYYSACAEELSRLIDAHVELSSRVLDPGLLGSAELLRRVYKAFLLVDETVDGNDSYLAAALAWGLSPAVLELAQAQVSYLVSGFPEAVGEMVVRAHGKESLERLLDLAQVRRPLAAIVDSSQHLSADAKSLGLLHYFGSEPEIGSSLAVQTLLREQDSDDDESVDDVAHACEERDVVNRVLCDYRQLYSFAEDGLRILAVNVKELPTILAGVEQFLKDYLKTSSADWPPFECTVMVYTTSSSPMAMESRLGMWRDSIMEYHREAGRPLSLSVGHRFAPMNRIGELLKRERKSYDVAFLFHFLRSGLSGCVEEAAPFAYDFAGWNGVQFPIAEYPRPVRDGDRLQRMSLLSNRRLRVQTRHADLSARLCYAGARTRDHLVFGQVDYKPWVPIVEELHAHAQWLACVDPFVDKRLLCSEDGGAARKIVGFSSGLGAYGELNLTISTEQDTLQHLAAAVAGRLTKLMPFGDSAGLESMAAKIACEAEEIIGLSSLRAVVGEDERIREVVGFSAIRRMLAPPHGHLSQLLPLDSMLHWFAGSDVSMRPDLLQITLELRPNDIPIVHAVLVECKLAQYSPAHVAKAQEQIQDGLRHLTNLFAPDRPDIRRTGFDRRFWWAQLHRAISSRSVVALPDEEWKALDQALESLSEGQFEIRWKGVVFTFWTNQTGASPAISSLPLAKSAIVPPFSAPEEFAIQHVTLGYDGVVSLFEGATTNPLVKTDRPCIVLRPRLVGPQMGGRADTPAALEELHGAGAAASTGTYSEGVDNEASTGDSQDPDGMMASEDTSTDMKSAPVSAGNANSSAIVASAVIDNVGPTVGLPRGGEATPTIPERILIGTKRNTEPVYWHFGHPQLPNRHLLLFGTSGSGKTYGIQCLLAEMAHARLHSLIVDYTDGFLPQHAEARFAEVVRPKTHFVISQKLPLNPFRRQMQEIDPSIPPIEETPYQVATRVQSIFGSVFQMGDQQSAALIRVLQSGLEEDDGFALDGVLGRLRDEGAHGESLANKLEPFIKADPFSAGVPSAWEDMLTAPEQWAHILQLKGLAREIQKIVTEFVLWDLWDYAQNSGSKNRPIPVVLDEIQNLDHGSDSPIGKMLREGRKFGMALILATQTTSQFDQEQRDRLFQAGHKLFFKPAATELDRFAHILAQSTQGVSKADWAQRLASLEKGQCWSLGPVLKSNGAFREEAVFVQVTALEQRDLSAPAQ